MICHGRHVPSQCPKQRKSPPGNIKNGLLIPGGGMLLFRALARIMTTTPYAFLNEVDPLCSLYSLTWVCVSVYVCM